MTLTVEQAALRHAGSKACLAIPARGNGPGMRHLGVGLSSLISNTEPPATAFRHGQEENSHG